MTPYEKYNNLYSIQVYSIQYTVVYVRYGTVRKISMLNEIFLFSRAAPTIT
jgi:hypothetical protein